MSWAVLSALLTLRLLLASARAEDTSYLQVHDLSELALNLGLDLGLVFQPPPPIAVLTVGPLESTEPPEQQQDHRQSNTTKPWPPESIIGYDSECGFRGKAVNESNRIVGGSEALPGEFPWQVSLQLKRIWSAKHVCGGAVLSPYWVVTAGHCVESLHADQLSVVAGDHNLFTVEGNEQRRQVVRIVSEGYDKKTFANDIALLQLERPLRLDGKHVAPICVPKPGRHYRQGSAVVSGWGRLSERGGLPHALQFVSLPLLSWPQCKHKYKSAGFSHFLHTCQICSGLEQGGADSCQGDSGGPLACRHADGRYYLCGVVSWGIGCARPQFPGVYTEVSCYARWIRKVLYNEDHFLEPQGAEISISASSP